MKHSLAILLSVTLTPLAFTQSTEKLANPSPSSDNLHEQIQAITGPTKESPTKSPKESPPPTTEPLPTSPTPKKEKGPTEIDALEATFDQKANQAIFIGEVVVKDPEFNVKCDKLTALLKGTEKAKSPTTPPALPPQQTKPLPTTTTPPPKKAGGLQTAIAEAKPGNRVLITQDKKDAEGVVQHSGGEADKATYDAESGDIVLTGNPRIQQGNNLIVSTDKRTKMTLNRDGHMRAQGPHKTIIIDKGTGL